MRNDVHTRTVVDAEQWARHHGPTGYDDPMAPTRGEAAEDAWLTAQSIAAQQRADDAARARGEYVPSPAMRTEAACIAIRLGQHGWHDLTVTPTRDSVLAITGPSAVAAVADVAGADRDRLIVQVADQTVWVRVLYPMLPPF